jgi:general stress protein CsbA
MEYVRIYTVGYTFYSQNGYLAVLIEASGCKKCSQTLRRIVNISKVSMWNEFVVIYHYLKESKRHQGKQ